MRAIIHTSPNWICLHPDLNSTGKSHVTAHTEFQLGKGPRQWIHSLDESLQFRVYNPAVINPWANWSSAFMLMVVFLSYKTWNVVKTQDLVGQAPSRASTISRFPTCLIHGVESLALTPGSLGTHSQDRPRQVRSKVRGLLCIVS